ncbi:MAG: hypothetical protein R6X22_06870 [Gemmatimonadota bacterium]
MSLPDRSSRVVAAVLLLLACAPRARAQEEVPPSRAADPGDVASLDAIIAAFYDVVSGPAGEPRDWGRDSTLYLLGVRFTVIRPGPDGTPVARTLDHGTWAAAAAPSLERGFFEREIHRTVRRFGPIADAFSTYEWSRTAEGPPEGRGINSLQLFHDGTRWWITAALWADEGPGAPIPPEYLPD